MSVVTQSDPGAQAGPGPGGDRLSFPSFQNISFQAGAVVLRDVTEQAKLPGPCTSQAAGKGCLPWMISVDVDLVSACFWWMISVDVAGFSPCFQWIFSASLPA